MSFSSAQRISTVSGPFRDNSGSHIVIVQYRSRHRIVSMLVCCPEVLCTTMTAIRELSLMHAPERRIMLKTFQTGGSRLRRSRSHR